MSIFVLDQSVPENSDDTVWLQVQTNYERYVFCSEELKKKLGIDLNYGNFFLQEFQKTVGQT